MTMRTQLNAGKVAHNEALQVRSALKAGLGGQNHNEALRVRSALKAGLGGQNHNEALRVRSALKAWRSRLAAASPSMLLIMLWARRSLSRRPTLRSPRACRSAV